MASRSLGSHKEC